MASDDQTEKATPQKRKDARRKGQVARSMEATSAITLLVGLYAIKVDGANAMRQLTTTTTRMLSDLSSFQATEQGCHSLLLETSAGFLKIVGPIVGAVLLAGIVANVAQVGVGFNLPLVAPDLSRIDPIKGIGRIFSPKGAVELLKSLLKVPILIWSAWAVIRSEQSSLLSLSVSDPGVASATSMHLVWLLCARMVTILVIAAGIDYAYQRFQHEKRIRMTRQEVRDEMKRNEGDPLIKSQFRQRHRRLVAKRMMADVPKADVVITNPTHIAVALRYDPEAMGAPTLVAKGQRLVAERIKEIARENGVPVIENKPVARALFGSAEVGDPVPVELYQSVAEILAFVYRLRNAGTGVRRAS